MGAREVLYDVEWQSVRVKCLASNSSKGGWMTEEGVEENLKCFLQYLHAVDIREVEFRRRCFRLRNALTATAMGYGSSKPELRARVIEARDKIPAPGEVDAPQDHWTAVWHELKNLDTQTFTMIRRDLKQRARGTTEQARPELFRFLLMMEEVRTA